MQRARSKDRALLQNELPVISRMFFRLAGILPYRIEERFSISPGVDLSIQNLLERNELSVKNSGFILILCNRRTIQVNSGKNSPSPRISKHLRLHLPVRIRSSIASHRTRSRGGIRTQLELT